MKWVYFLAGLCVLALGTVAGVNQWHHAMHTLSRTWVIKDIASARAANASHGKI